MSLLVVGSLAYDTIKTPHGEVRDALGGAAVYSALAASLFGPVRLVGVVGDDFAPAWIEALRQRGVDTAGLQVVRGGRTFRWSGEYYPDMNRRDTLSVELNVLADFRPVIPAAFRGSRLVFLGNAAPRSQLSVLDQVDSPELVMADTMDLWIQTEHQALLDLLRRIDALSLNDSEAMLLTDRRTVIEAGKAILGMGPSRVIVKKGEHGAILFSHDEIVPLPAYPTPIVVDPTGAGDSFAGGAMGFLARVERIDCHAFKQAMAHGIVTASFTVEDFGTTRLGEVSEDAERSRFEEYSSLLRI